MKTIMQKTILTCRDVEEFMIDYVDGGMSLLTRLQFTMHVMICSDCRKYLKMYKDTIALGKRVFDRPDDDAAGQVPDEILHAIMVATEKK